jgi:hypothetical protein
MIVRNASRSASRLTMGHQIAQVRLKTVRPKASVLIGVSNSTLHPPTKSEKQLMRTPIAVNCATTQIATIFQP